LTLSKVCVIGAVGVIQWFNGE